MTYTKTSWVSGSTIFASALNNLETQYDKVSTDWGPFKFTTGSTSATKIYEDLSTYNKGFSDPIGSVFEGTNNYAKIHIPCNLQPCEVTFEISGRTCSTAGVIGTYVYFSRFIMGPLGVVSYTAPIEYFFTTTAYVSRSSYSMKVYPGETIEVMGYTSASNLGSIKDIRLWGASTTPSTGIVYT